MDPPATEINMPLVLAKNVSDFLVECWNTNTAEWVSGWDATSMLPPLVRVTVGFGNKSSGGGQVITREISFPASTMPTAVQTPNNNNGSFQGGQGFFNNSQGSGGNSSSPFNPYTPGPGSGMNNGPPGRPLADETPNLPTATYAQLRAHRRVARHFCAVGQRGAALVFHASGHEAGSSVQ